MNHSEQISELATALAKAQGEILAPVKDSDNPFYHSKYADLDAIREAIRLPLSRNGLSITQEIHSLVEGDRAHFYLSALLMHSSGQWIGYDKVEIPILDDPESKTRNWTNPQKVKSGVTYMARIQLLRIFGLAEADDDGNVASGHTGSPPCASPPPVNSNTLSLYPQERGRQSKSSPPPKKPTSTVPEEEQGDAPPDVIDKLEKSLRAATTKSDLANASLTVKRQEMSSKQRNYLRAVYKEALAELTGGSNADVR